VWLLLAPLARGQHVGSKACAGCHPTQFDEQSKTGHARALSRPSEHVLARFFSPSPAEWAFGAGEQAVTFVSQVDEDWYLEHGLSYYASTESMGLTPGHSSSSGERYRTFNPNAAILRCFQCHSTGPLELGAKFQLVPFELGVRCEACHGAGQEHVKLQGVKSAIKNPKKLPADALNQFCGSCHRKPPAAGDDTNWNNAWNIRHQPLYFSQSPCFRESRGALSCLTCHSPHSPLVHTATEYDRRCATCHAKPRHRSSIGGQSCVRCHMPEVKPQTNLRFANHWIGIYAGGKPLRPKSSDK
jgi:Cytochrome c554 and c-prime